MHSVYPSKPHQNASPHDSGHCNPTALQYDAKVKYRITPRLTSEIFLRRGKNEFGEKSSQNLTLHLAYLGEPRGILRTLWDIDRLLRADLRACLLV